MPMMVILAVTDPRTGIQRRLKWPPSIAEMVEACDVEVARQDTRRRYAQMPPPVFKRIAPPRDDRPGRRANVFVPADSAHYARCAKIATLADPADWKLDPDDRKGIWIALNLFNGSNRKDGTFKPVAAPTDAELRAYYSTQQQAA